MADTALEIMPTRIRHEPVPAATSGATTPMDMLNLAVSRGAGLEVVAKLMDLQERWEAGQARKAFDAAIAAAKADIPLIAKNAKGHNDKRYANFAAYAKVVDPIISQHGLSYRFRTSQTDRINVTCILSHEAGHFEENTLSGPADTSGSKNAIQAIGSTLTYLQRYSLIQALGLAAGDDDDGKAGGSGDPSGPITEAQTKTLLALIDDIGMDAKSVDVWFETLQLPANIGVADIPAASFGEAIALLHLKQRAKRQKAVQP